VSNATTTASSSQRQTVSVMQAAAILGLSKERAYRSAKDGTLPTLRFGRKLVVPMAALESMLAGQATGQSQQPG